MHKASLERPHVEVAAGPDLTALVITFNEAPNIARVLAHLKWVPKVIVLDSGSTDATLSICAAFENVTVVTRAFDSFAQQCNHGLGLIESEWCLSIDADYVVPVATAREMREAIAADRADGWSVPLAYCIRGRTLRRAILPPRTVLFRTKLGRYEQDGHAHRLALSGAVRSLQNAILHDDRKPLRRWLMSQETYAQQEVEKLAEASWRELRWPDRIRRAGWIAPWLVPSFYLFARGGLFEGWAGLDYAAQRALAELVLSIKLIEHARLAEPTDDP